MMMTMMMTVTTVTTVARTGKLHLVVDDTEAEHVRVSHQYFLVLIKKSFLLHGSQI